MATKAFKKLPARAKRAAFAAMDDNTGKIPKGGRAPKGITAFYTASKQARRDGGPNSGPLWVNATNSFMKRSGTKANYAFKQNRRKA